MMDVIWSVSEGLRHTGLASGSGSRAARRPSPDRHDLIEGKSARTLAAAGLLARAEPDEHLAAVPARALEALGHTNARARNFLLVKVVANRHGQIETLAQELRARFDPFGWVRVALDRAQERGAAQLDFANVVLDMHRNERDPVFRHRGHDLVLDRGLVLERRRGWQARHQPAMVPQCIKRGAAARLRLGGRQPCAA